MSTKQKASIPLWRHIWRSHLRSALLPLILIELLLISAYLITNNFVGKENIKTMSLLADKELSRLVQQESKRIEQALHSVEQLTELYRYQSERAYRTSFNPGKQELERYHFSPEGAWFTATDIGTSAAYYSAITKIGEKEQQKAWQLAQLDPIMIDIQESNPLVAQIYLNTHDSLNRIYPYLAPIEAFGESLDIPSYNFYYDADGAHNPERKIVWTKVYIDPAGQGWLTSCIAPVYQGDFLEAVVGLDVTVKTIIDYILDITIPWGGSVFLVDHKGTIMAMSSKGEQLLGLTELTGHHYDHIIKQDTFKPEQYNIHTQTLLKDIGGRIFETGHGIAPLELSNNPQVAGWATISQTGWKLLILVPEKNILSAADKLKNRIQKISWMIIAGAALFALFFLIFLYFYTRRTSLSIAKPIDLLDQMASKIGNGETTQALPTSTILEIDHTAENLALMEQKLNENQRKIEKNAQRLKTILETVNEGFWLIDNDTFTLDVNPCMCRILGREREQIMGRSVFDFVDPENEQIFREQIKKRAKGESGNYEIVLSCPNERKVPCLFNVSPLMKDGKVKIGAFAMVTDLSAQKKTEAALHTLFQKSTDGVLLIDDKHFIDCNEAIISMLKYSCKEELLQTHPSELSPEFQPDGKSSYEKAEEMMQICLTSGSNRFEWMHQKADGEDFWVDVVLTRLEMDNKILIHTAWRDISEKKTSEEELEKKNIALALMLEQVRTAQQEAEHAVQARSTFLANMSHEIRTPMGGIIGMTDLALDTELTPEQQNFLNNIKISAGGLLDLLNDILDFSKIEAGQLLIESQDFSLPGTLDNIISVMTFAAEEKGLKLILQTNTSKLPVFVKGDELRLRQILVNLIGNSIKFTEKGSVTLSVAPENRGDGLVELHFIIIDTGIGIPANKQETLFSIFSQGDASTTRKFGGTGLGLTICKQLVEIMGGKIWIESNVEQGAIFHFTIILDHGDEKNLQQQDDTVIPQVRKLDILLVDDNEMNCEIARYVLEQDEHRIVTAENGIESLEILASQHFDLILMDVQMPVMDGLTTTTIIRASENNSDLSHFDLPPSLPEKLIQQCKGRHIPIVAMTANAMEGDKEKCLATGMDTYLTKPFEPAQVRAVIADIIK